MNASLTNRNKCVAISCTFVFIFLNQQLFAQPINQTPIKQKPVWFRAKNKSNFVFCNCEKYQKRADKEFELLAKSKIGKKRKTIWRKRKILTFKTVKEKRRKRIDSKSVRCFKW